MKQAQYLYEMKKTTGKKKAILKENTQRRNRSVNGRRDIESKC